MDELQKYYDYLKANGADVPPSLESFRKTLQDEKSSRQYYDYLRQNNFDTPETYDSFVGTFGLKKKDQSGVMSSPTPSDLSSQGVKATDQFNDIQRRYKAATGQGIDMADPVSSVKVALTGSKLPVISRSQTSSTAVKKPIQAEQINQEAQAIKRKDIKAVENYFKEDTNNALATLSNATGLSPEQLYDDQTSEQLKQSIDPNNQTLQLSLQRLQEAKNARKAILQGGDLEDMAANFAASQNPEFKAQLDKLQSSGQYQQQDISQILGGAPQQEVKYPARLVLGDATTGRLLYDFFTNSAVRQEAAQNPELEKAMKERAVNLMSTNKEFGKNYVGGLLSQKMEDMGINNGILNVVTKSEADKVVDQLMSEGQMTEREKLFYQEEIRPRLGLENLGRAIVGKPSVQTTGLIENALQGGVGTLHNIGKGVAEITGARDLISGQQGALSSDTEALNRRNNVSAKGLWHEMTQTGGQMLGQSLALGGVGGGLKAAGLIKSPMAALAVAGGMQAYGNYAPEARMKFPDSIAKQRGYATVLAVIEAASENIFRDDKVVKGLVGDFKPFVKKTIEDFTDKNISAAAASDLLESQFKQFAKKYAKSVSEETLEEVAADLGQQITDGIFEGKPAREWVDTERLLETARSAMIGSTFLSGLAARSDMKKSGGAIAKNIYLMAQSPEFWKQQIQEDAKLNPELEAEAADKIANLDYASSLLQELDGQNLTDKQKAKYIVTSLDSKIKGENMSSKEDPILRAKENEKSMADIQANDQMKKDILEGNDDGSIEGDESDKTSPKEKAAIKLVNDHIENGLITGIYAEYGQNDPISLLQEIAQQAQGIDANGNELPGGGRAEDLMKMGITDELINASVELYPRSHEGGARDSFDQDNIEEEPDIPSGESQQGEASGEIRLSHADTKKIYQDHNLPGRLDTPTKSDMTLGQEADKLVNDGYDFDAEAAKVMTGEKKSFSDAEQVAFGKMVSALQEQQKGLDINDPRFTELQDKIEKYSRASDIVGTLAGRAFRARRSFSEQPETLSDYIMEDKKYAGSSEQTEEQKEATQREFNEITAAEKALKDKVTQLEEENKKLKAEAEIKRIAKEVKKSDKKDYVQKRQDLVERLKKEAEDYKSSINKMGVRADGGAEATIISFKMAKTILEIAKSYIEEGIDNLVDVVAKTLGDAKDIDDRITERDIRDIIAGVYNAKKESQSDLAAKLRDLQTEQKLLDQIEALENGEVPKSERKKRQRNVKLEELRKKIKGYEPKKAADRNERLKKQIEALQAKLDAGDYGPDVKPEPITLDEEGIELHAKLVKLKNERKYRQLKEQYENEKAWDRAKRIAIEVLNLPRALMATLDFSALLRQAVIPSFSRPITAGRAAGQMFKNAFSKKEYDLWFDNLQRNPRYEGMKKSKLGLTDPNNPALEAREEAFMSGLAGYFPLIGGKKIKGVPVGFGLIEGSERAYSTALNKIRVDMYHRFAEQMEKRGLTIESDPDAYKQMAQYVNNATGRGDLTTTLNTAAPFLNALFFSPRLIASRVNMLTYLLQPRFYKTVPKEVRVAYVKDMLSFLGVGLAILGLAKAIGADVEDDPRSSDFGKIKSGNTRWDIWGGFQQYARVASQLISGERKSTATGQIQKLDGQGPYGDSKTDVAFKFGRGKLAPVPSMVVDLIGGQNIVGEKIVWEKNGDKEIGASEYAAQHLLPLNATGLYEALQDDGIKALFTVGVPSTFGVGVQTFSDDKKEKTAQEKREEKRRKKEEGPTKEEKRAEKRRKRERERQKNND